MPRSSMPLLTMNVTLHEPELVGPARPTPREVKPLSDIDDQESLRFHVPVMLFYPAGASRKVDPARVIREALGEALVYYYPWAGRLREGPGRKLMVNCNGEGVVFVEAEADVGLVELGLAGEGGFLHPPFPDELLFDVPGSYGILDSPLLFIQVTKLKCGGFVMAIWLNHTLTDAPGLFQFMTAIAELARGAPTPSVLPVWNRDLLRSRDPPRASCTHREYDQVEGSIFPLHHEGDVVIERSFFFGSHEISCLRHLLHPKLRSCTTFELLSGFLWRCRTIALGFDPSQEVRYLCIVNMRSKMIPPLPSGYYGNAFVFPAAVSTARELSSNNLNYAIELIKKAKTKATKEYVRSVTDLMATSGRPFMTVPGSWVVSDNMHTRYLDIDFGGGKPVYGGPSSAMVGPMPGPIGFFVKGVNGKGETGVFLLICLPELAMERFATEVNSVVGKAGVWSLADVCSKL